MKTARMPWLDVLGCLILAAVVAAGEEATPRSSSTPTAPPVLCFKAGTPEWYVEQAVARANLRRFVTLLVRRT